MIGSKEEIKLSNLKVVKELDRAIRFDKIEDIYEKGHKVAISFNKDTWIDNLDLVLKEGQGYTEGLLDRSSIECKEEFVVKGNNLYIKANTFVVIEDAREDSDITCSVFSVHPFEGVNTDCYSEFFAYYDEDTYNIADRVVEVD